MNEKNVYKPKEDPMFQEPFIDMDETRDRDGIEYRLIHGGFKGTNVKFTFCFPDKKDFKGRFYQYLSPFPGPDEEWASMDKTGEDDRIKFAITHGAYSVESNMGSNHSFSPGGDDTIFYRSSAAVAEYSRKVAMDIYGCSRPYGYVYGGSGGGYKTMSCLENTEAFDGGVPYVIGSPVSLPNVISIRGHGMRLLRNVIPQIADALEPGGSGDPYKGLNEEEAAALEELTRFGFPLRGWLQWPYLDDGSLPVLAPGVKMADPEYFEKFWKESGYLGADPNGHARRDRILIETRVTTVSIPTKEEIEEASKENQGSEGLNRVDDAWKKMMQKSFGKPWIEVEEVPKGENLYLDGCNVVVESGKAKGSTMLLMGIEDNKLILGAGFGTGSVEEILEKLKPGDRVKLDNSDYIAIQSYHRHRVPEKEYITWDQYRDENGAPLYPQRDSNVDISVKEGGCRCKQNGKFHGKAIVVAALEDESAFPWQAAWYRDKVSAANPGREEEIFRLWFMEHSNHGDMSSTLGPLHLVPYLGALYQALLSLSDWVEKGTPPWKTTEYKVDDGQVIVPTSVKDRNGVQPVVKLTANDSDCVRVKVGEEVSFKALARVPENGGKVTHIDFSFQGEHDFPYKGKVVYTDKEGSGEAKTSHTYNSPGSYFAVARVKSNVEGDKENIFTQIQNLSRVRVIVE